MLSKQEKYKRIDKASERANEDWLNKKNHLKGKFSETHSVIGWSIECLLNCNIPYTLEAEQLLYNLSGKIIEGKKMPRWSNSSHFSLGINYKVNQINKYYDIFYHHELRFSKKYLYNIKRRKYPCILVQDCLNWNQCFTNFENYHYPPNIQSDACQELLSFVNNEKNIKFTNNSKHLTIKVAFWNKRFPIIKIEFPNDKYIITYSHYFARLNNSNDKSNKYYYD